MIAHRSTRQPTNNQRSLVAQGMHASINARTEAGADLKSPICIYSLCDAFKVPVRFNDVNMEGMYDRVPRPRIHLSALRPLVRRNFTCAHELGHHVFGHGSTIDELREEQQLNASRPATEILADAFAAFVLMPTLGLRAAFAVRGVDPNKATAAQLYSIACNFGVGQKTLLNHLAFGVEMMSRAQWNRLQRITPKMIRADLLGEITSEPLTIADEYWSSAALDTEQNSLLLLPSEAVVDTSMITPLKELPAGRLCKAVRCGISRVAIPGTSWATYVRIARSQYVGLARFRHLEETADD